MYQYTCGFCSTDYNHPNRGSKYCSRKCRDAAARTIPPSTCLTCGQPVRKRKYCCPECYHQSLKGKPSQRNTRILLPCQVCGKEELVKAYRRNEFKYCSRECYLAVHTANNVTPELELLRNSAQYRTWRTAVFERDSYTCVSCGDHNYTGRGETVLLHADHIKSFAHYPELRFDPANGRTLCVPCHRTTDTYGGKSRRRIAVDATGY